MALVAGSAARAEAQLTVTQTSGCPAAALSSPVSSAHADTSERGNPPPRDTMSRGPSGSGQPDVVLIVAFSADELRFNTQPDARIRFCWGSDSLHIVERRNLPSPVIAGTTYKNVFIAAELRAYLNAECLSQRLGLAGPATTTKSDACAELGLSTADGVVKAKPLGTTSVSGASR